ncbi:hypothetical protein [Phormidium pseudopriestleyi]|nr:hypothetical protein [Phormidium pseudopriestleyi]
MSHFQPLQALWGVFCGCDRPSYFSGRSHSVKKTSILAFLI